MEYVASIRGTLSYLDAEMGDCFQGWRGKLRAKWNLIAVVVATNASSVKYWCGLCGTNHNAICILYTCLRALGRVK